MMGLVLGCQVSTSLDVAAADRVTHSLARHAMIPVLGTTWNKQWEQVGVVASIYVELQHRDTSDGIDIQFDTRPGRFSRRAQRAVISAILTVAERAGLDPRTWSVRFTLPYDGVTLYGESLAAMAALTVIALAKNEEVRRDTVITGTVTPDGTIGTVGGVPLKIVAAHHRHFRRVLIPEEQDIADGEWRTPFLMQVSPVRSVAAAYRALTNRPLALPAQDTRLAAQVP